MNQMTNYKTKQKEELCNYLKQLRGTHVRVHDIADHFADHGIAVGITTIYRHLHKMVSDGIVKKYVVEGISGACFEYIGDSIKNNEEQRFHLKCQKCGKLIHFHCKELIHLQRHLSDDHGFDIDSPKTVFYGSCNQCTQIR